MRWYAQDEVNQEESEQNEVDGMKKGADSTGNVMCIKERLVIGIVASNMSLIRVNFSQVWQFVTKGREGVKFGQEKCGIFFEWPLICVSIVIVLHSLYRAAVSAVI